MRIPILTYQPMHIDGNDYRANDLKALASDLRQLTDSGFKIVPLRSVVDAWLDNRGSELNGKLVALACDDGSDFDYVDLPHPTAGTQRSVFNILRDFAADNPGKQDEINITSFVIVSPEARAALDSTCMIGKGWWTDAWWSPAIRSGLMHIGNHSWDHHHESLPHSFSQGVPRGTFLTINSKGLADYEIRLAAEYLREHAPNPGIELFAYPYGESNPYLTREYFPRYGTELGIKAAFTDRAAFLEPGSSRWEIPRFMCGRDWRSPAELQAILDAAADAQRVWVPVRRNTYTLMSPPRDAASTAIFPSESGAGGKASPDLITDEGFRTKFIMVPNILGDWIGEHRKLEGLDIMDFGCGEGTAALALALNFGPRRVVGVDIGPDPERCLPDARAQLGLTELPSNLTLHRVRPGFLHSDEDRFDVVYSWSVFEHVDERLMGGVLKLIRSCLKPDGLFFVQIAPLYYSSEGSHLTHKIDEPWGHLLHQHDVFYEKLQTAAPDESELQALWGTYSTLNRMTADELTGQLRDNGFEILRTYTTKEERDPPQRLKAIFKEEVLTTNQILVLSRPI